MGDHNWDIHGWTFISINAKFASSRVKKTVVSGAPFRCCAVLIELAMYSYLHKYGRS